MEIIKKNIWGIVVLVVAGVASFILVSRFKDPGQLTVIEANVMDMSAMKPPEGAVPVAMEKARQAEMQGIITYTGTVRAYEDEDVVTRIAGLISKMPVYPGDRVKRGQILAQLDPSQSEYETRVQEATAGGDSAMHFAGMARSDFKTAKYRLKASEAAERAAQKELAEAKADYGYWKPEIKRQAALLKEDVVSQQEYDSELAKHDAAKARFDRARAKLEEATNNRLAAKSLFDKAVHHVGHEYSASEEARAKESTARIINSYRFIKAQDDSVVIKRVVSPGVTVKPGTLILKLAHINRVRVQAEVSNSDLGKVRLGAPVSIYESEKDRTPVKASVTSIFPAADSSTRTSIVEALIDNYVDVPDDRSGKPVKQARQYRFLPGQYAVMRISTGSREALSVPTEAIFRRGEKAYVWVADSGAGKMVAKLVQVKNGLSNPDRTEILSGLTSGDRIIFRGYRDLEPGQVVVGVKWTDEGLLKMPKSADIGDSKLNKTNGWSVTQSIDLFKLKINLAPTPPADKSNRLEIVIESKGKVLDNAAVSGTSFMTGMKGMKGPSFDMKGSGSGRYAASTDFPSGSWETEIAIESGGKSRTLSVQVEVP